MYVEKLEYVTLWYQFRGEPIKHNGLRVLSMLALLCVDWVQINILHLHMMKSYTFMHNRLNLTVLLVLCAH